MKAMDLLKYLDKADPAYIEEASDYNLLLYRKGRKRTRVALAASLALVVLAGVFLTKPALYAWETRNTVASWRDNGGFVYLEFDKPSSPLFVSAEMPDQKKFAADTPFTLSVGMGQVADYEYATLSVKAYGFEITDKDGNTVTDRYVRTFSNFNSGDYGMVYRNGKPTSPVTGCQYFEDFTLRFVGSENTTGWGVIEFSLNSRTENGSMGDTVTVYYTIQNGVLKLTHKNPVRDGSQNGSLGAVLEETDTVPNQAKTVEFSYGGDNITVSVTDPFLARGEAWQEKIKISGIPMFSDYMVALYPKDTTEGRIIRLMLPSTFSSLHDFVIPADALLGSYDLVVTWYGFLAGSGERPEWVFEDFVTVTEPDTVTLSKEDFSIRVDMPSGALTLGQFLGDKCHITAFHVPTQKDYPTDGFTAELIYAESLREDDFSFVIKKPLELDPNGDFVLALSPRVPMDAPIGSYDLRVTDPATGFEWTYENVVTILPDERGIPAYEDLICDVTALRETTLAQGMDFQSTIIITLWDNGTDQNFFCSAVLVYAEDGGEACAITVKDSPFSSTASPTYIPTDAPVGDYDLIVTDARYGYSWRFNHFIEVIPNPYAQKYVFFTDIDIVDPLTVSRSSDETYTFSGGVENRGLPFTVTVTPQSGFVPTATLVYADAPADSGEIYELPLRAVTGPEFEPYEVGIPTGTVSPQIFEIMVTPDTPCGLYDLTLTYEDCTVTFEGVVEVVP